MPDQRRSISGARSAAPDRRPAHQQHQTGHVGSAVFNQRCSPLMSLAIGPSCARNVCFPVTPAATPRCRLRNVLSAHILAAPNRREDRNLDQRFTRTEVARMTGATRKQLDYWARLGLVHPRSRWGERFFSFTDLVAVETLSRLAQQNIPARRLLRAMHELDILWETHVARRLQLYACLRMAPGSSCMNPVLPGGLSSLSAVSGCSISGRCRSIKKCAHYVNEPPRSGSRWPSLGMQILLCSSAR